MRYLCKDNSNTNNEIMMIMMVTKITMVMIIVTKVTLPSEKCSRVGLPY